ncbi:uncharacterized protein CEXT_740051 [Caerostris extrusa]|uniref:Prokineticin domain-containing protein n=1 Tax=Caerostris extrusa TaxID=172846 RepID=A0AAV4M958_CAEEX|nr:uncharacterized protein CEXT_740051 [Caerostris extrusa]
MFVDKILIEYLFVRSVYLFGTSYNIINVFFTDFYWMVFYFADHSSLLQLFRKDKLEENDKPCTKHADCAEDECCTFEAVPTLATTSTRIIWRCKALGEVKDFCHSLGNVYCPCKPGLRCIAKAVWFFGSGMCGAI